MNKKHLVSIVARINGPYVDLTSSHQQNCQQSLRSNAVKIVRYFLGTHHLGRDIDD